MAGGTKRLPRAIREQQMLDAAVKVFSEKGFHDTSMDAIAAAAIGAERFVLDDGWFRGRDDDTSSLGDWEIDKAKFPDGLAPLIDQVA